jgi:serine/threonine-protein kinase PRP4
MNLREALGKFGKNIGINVRSVQIYARQLFSALRFIGDLGVIHADIKPDNILVSADLKRVKVCDFGSAFLESDADSDPTPYLVSRFYRAPEIVLGLAYGLPLDLWSVCTCLHELFTGQVMFPGSSNNDMLRLMQRVKGRFPNKMVKAHLRSYELLAKVLTPLPVCLSVCLSVCLHSYRTGLSVFFFPFL